MVFVLTCLLVFVGLLVSDQRTVFRMLPVHSTNLKSKVVVDLFTSASGPEKLISSILSQISALNRLNIHEMATCTELLKKEFPKIDSDLQNYVESKSMSCTHFFRISRSASHLIIACFNLFSGILDSVDDFDTSEEIYEAIGEILHEVGADKSEKDIK